MEVQTDKRACKERKTTMIEKYFVRAKLHINSLRSLAKKICVKRCITFNLFVEIALARAEPKP